MVGLGRIANFNPTGSRLVDEYAKMLSGSHSEGCPWRNKSCDGGSSFHIWKLFVLVLTSNQLLSNISL